MRKSLIFVGIFALCAAGAAALLLPTAQSGVQEDLAFTVPNTEPMTPQQAQKEFYRLAPALLLEVYDAFGKTEEAEIYDTLATVTHGNALEYLYLERVGAMAGDGLDEADQTLHEIKLLSSSAQSDGEKLSIDASWQVIGTVGHAEHIHVRGNTYSADLSVAPIDGAWRITDFELMEVNRDDAGQTFLVPSTEQ
ncbi:MAG: hypothetical protein AAF141_01675 [Pseudomonadota bacterium]